MAEHAGPADRHLPRGILLIPDPPLRMVTTFDVAAPETRFARIEPLRSPRRAPSIAISMLDDDGFGASSAFGDPVSAPAPMRPARNGMTYTRSHRMALCSRTRSALPTGRNYHSVGMGRIADMAMSSPG